MRKIKTKIYLIMVWLVMGAAFIAPRTSQALEGYTVAYAGTLGGWWASVDVYNNNAAESSISVTFFDANGVAVGAPLVATIAPYAHYGFMSRVGSQTITITGPTNLLLTPYQGNGTSAFTILPVYLESALKN